MRIAVPERRLAGQSGTGDLTGTDVSMKAVSVYVGQASVTGMHLAALSGLDDFEQSTKSIVRTQSSEHYLSLAWFDFIPVTESFFPPASQSDLLSTVALNPALDPHTIAPIASTVQPTFMTLSLYGKHGPVTSHSNRGLGSTMSDMPSSRAQSQSAGMFILRVVIDWRRAGRFRLWSTFTVTLTTWTRSRRKNSGLALDRTGCSRNHLCYDSGLRAEVDLTDVQGPWSSFAADGLPYVGFPGLSLTPIQESPFLDSPLTERDFDRDGESERWKEPETRALVMEERANAKKLKASTGYNKRWGSETTTVTVETGGTEKSNGVTSSKSCSVNVQVMQTTFVPKDGAMSLPQKRSHVCKLLLFALFGFVVVAGIVIWVFSPAFT
ncbi:hypothetical protein BaRGS_00001079 [Batillaria attramentaria]|uniref:Transmembrane protein n=1 Tax=Batillaria attramentaria TaxID=370345 RepID=A0ABD0M6Y7_9CAEN